MNNKTSSYIISDRGKLQLVIHRRNPAGECINNNYPIDTRTRSARINAYIEDVRNIRFVNVDSTFQYLAIYLMP